MWSGAEEPTAIGAVAGSSTAGTRRAPTGPPNPVALPVTSGQTAKMLVEIYQRWLFEVWGNGDEAAARELIREDLIDHNPLPGQPPGRAGDLWAARAVRKAFPDLQFTLDVAFEHGDLVTGRWTMTGTHTGPFDLLSLPATGRPVTMSGQEIFRVRDAQLAEVWHAEDIGALQRALALEPPKAMLRLAARISARRYRQSQRRR
jgi:predicted ester cyclase